MSTTLSINKLIECLGSVHWGESQPTPREQTQATRFLIGADSSQPEVPGQMPFMDHWKVPRPHVSLRDIIKEEQALQQTVEKVSHIPNAPVDLSNSS